jgi:hypothetical protein
LQCILIHAHNWVLLLQTKMMAMIRAWSQGQQRFSRLVRPEELIPKSDAIHHTFKDWLIAQKVWANYWVCWPIEFKACGFYFDNIMLSEDKLKKLKIEVQVLQYSRKPNKNHWSVDLATFRWMIPLKQNEVKILNSLVLMKIYHVELTLEQIQQN